MWVREESNEVPKKLWKGCDQTTSPNLHVLLQICLTLPITSCERSFSQLKLTKSSRQSTMTEERLGELALMKFIVKTFPFSVKWHHYIVKRCILED